MLRTFHLAVLEAQAPPPNTLAARGTYGDIFYRALRVGLLCLGQKGAAINLEVSKWDVFNDQAFPEIQDVDGVLITGSARNAFDDDPETLKLLDFVAQVHREMKPIIGICYGHQLVARMLGATVDRNPLGWELSHTRVVLNQHGQDYIGLSTFDIHQFHQDIVLNVPDSVINLGSSRLCQNQAFYRPGRILTFQGHPEFDADIMTELLGMPGALTERQVERALSLVGFSHDGWYLVTKMMDFLLESTLWI